MDITLFILGEENAIETDCFVIAPFVGEAKCYSINQQLILNKDELANLSFRNARTLSEHAPASKKEHVALVRNGLDFLKSGGAEKVVLSRTRSIEVDFSASQLFQKLEEKYPSACVFLFNTVKTGCWMGATPERLIKVENGMTTSASLAGTRGIGEKQDWGEKELEEQRLVTDEIKTVFLKSGLVGISESELKTKKAGSIEHLFTEVSGQMPDGLPAAALAAKLHPTPAVGGLPKQNAVDYILGNEKYDREFYTGYFGIQSDKSSRFYVNLRSMQLFKNGLVLYAGGGITASSNPEAEWEETERKLRTLLDVIEDEENP